MEPPILAPEKMNLEQCIIDIIKKILKQPQLTTEDNFLMLGGDSLLALELITKIKSNFYIELQLEEIFSLATVEEIIVLIRTQLESRLHEMSEDQLQNLLHYF